MSSLKSDDADVARNETESNCVPHRLKLESLNVSEQFDTCLWSGSTLSCGSGSFINFLYIGIIEERTVIGVLAVIEKQRFSLGSRECGWISLVR